MAPVVSIGETVVPRRIRANATTGSAKDGCVARRRAVYAAQIAARSTISTRLAATDVHGLRRAA